MKKVKIFARTFWKSLTKPDYYRDILTAKFSFSLKYLFFLLFVLSLIVGVKTAVVIAKLMPKIPNFVSETKKVVLEIYPQELKITLKDKKITTNVKEPYFIEFPKESGLKDVPFKHLVAIDTKAGAEDYKKYESVFLVTDEVIVSINNNSGGVGMISVEDVFKDIPNETTLDRELYQQNITKALPYLDYLPNVAKVVIILTVTILPLLSAAGWLLKSLIILLPVSLLLYLIAKILKRTPGFAKIYQLSMHGLTIPVTFSTVFVFFEARTPLLVFYWAAFIIFMFVVIQRLEEAKFSAGE